jgi:hypothetical protein
MGKWVNIIGEGKGKRYDVQDPFRDNAGRLSKIYISCFIEDLDPGCWDPTVLTTHDLISFLKS